MRSGVLGLLATHLGFGLVVLSRCPGWFLVLGAAVCLLLLFRSAVDCPPTCAPKIEALQHVHTSLWFKNAVASFYGAQSVLQADLPDIQFKRKRTSKLLLLLLLLASLLLLLECARASLSVPAIRGLPAVIHCREGLRR